MTTNTPEYAREYKRSRYHTDPEFRQKCLDQSKRWREENLERFNTRQRSYNPKRTEHRRAVRREVIENYGGQCACCGETEYAFLTIDHVNNDGAEHRKIVAQFSLPMWIKKNNYPPEFQVLCYNCNCAKQFSGLGVCPHNL